MSALKTYNITIIETGEVIRQFVGEAMLDVCLATWTRIKGKEISAVEQLTAN